MLACSMGPAVDATFMAGRVVASVGKVSTSASMKLGLAPRRYVYRYPLLLSLFALVAVLAATVPASAAPSPAAKCAAAKQKAVGKY
jgi:hypothetical protein